MIHDRFNILIARDKDWLSANGVILSRVIVVMVPCRIGQSSMQKKESKGRGQDLSTFLRQPLTFRPPGQTNSEEGIVRDRAFAQRAETTAKLKALRLAQLPADAAPRARTRGRSKAGK